MHSRPNFFDANRQAEGTKRGLYSTAARDENLTARTVVPAVELLIVVRDSVIILNTVGHNEKGSKLRLDLVLKIWKKARTYLFCSGATSPAQLKKTVYLP